jgi:hypothetical protein
MIPSSDGVVTLTNTFNSTWNQNQIGSAAVAVARRMNRSAVRCDQRRGQRGMPQGQHRRAGNDGVGGLTTNPKGKDFDVETELCRGNYRDGDVFRSDQRRRAIVEL